ncbi:katG [Ectocarpus sp. CCAP 1310/34]|nr:katG [Ectocarpus sp. CCAP 1310/34]
MSIPPLPRARVAFSGTNQQALTLLTPITLKYGDAISWGDLITLTGDMAISSMGGPILEFCAGRQDDFSGYDSLELGPSEEQEATAPCAVNGTCEVPLGTSTVGPIYVNPGGPIGVPESTESAPQIREVFARMGMHDTETVALIGGGLAFGKFRWPTSSHMPSLSDRHHHNLLAPTYAGHPVRCLQERFTGRALPVPGADPIDAPEDPWPGTCGDPDSDTFGQGENTFTYGFERAWTEEPTDTEYLPIVEEFASNQEALDIAFSNAWYKLVTPDMGPHTRCVGTDVPLPQDFQRPLPDTPTVLSSYTRGIGQILEADSTHASLFLTLAYQCASTFRSTDYTGGGCDGARIRFPLHSEWTSNAGLSTPVKDEYPDIFFADLIVLAGHVSLKEGGSVPNLSYCKGRVDAEEDDPNHELLDILESHTRVAQMVALAGRPRSSYIMNALGYSGSYTEDDAADSSGFCAAEEVDGMDGTEYQAVGKSGVYVLATDLALVWDAEFKAQSILCAQDNDYFLEHFGSAWTAWMNADRFDRMQLG